MSLPQFNDGFPNQAQQAVNFSYFLTPEEKAEWTQWLTTATEEQKDELVTILHQMWEQSKSTAVPNNFGGQTNVQPVAVNQQQPVQPVPQQAPVTNVQAYSNPADIVQQMPSAMSAMGQFSQPSSQSNPAPTQPYNNPFAQEQPKPVEAPKSDLMVKDPSYTPNPIISDPQSVENVQFQTEPTPPVQPQPLIVEDDIVDEEDEFEFETEDDLKTYAPPAVKASSQLVDDKKSTEAEAIEEVEEVAPRRTSTSGIDFTAIRENSNKNALAALKEEYINARETQEAVYGDFVQKTTEILSNFEDINDYIEAMTDKVLSINDEVVSQAQDIQDLKNSTQTRGPALQDQVDELRYDIEKLAKELRNVRIEIKRSNDELRQRLSLLEADSFRQANDGIEARISLIKSDISKMQEAINNQSNNSLNQVANNFSLPQQNPRISRLSSVNFKK